MSIVEIIYGISGLSSGFGFIVGILAGGLLTHFMNYICSKITRE